MAWVMRDAPVGRAANDNVCVMTPVWIGWELQGYKVRPWVADLNK